MQSTAFFEEFQSDAIRLETMFHSVCGVPYDFLWRTVPLQRFVALRNTENQNVAVSVRLALWG